MICHVFQDLPIKNINMVVLQTSKVKSDTKLNFFEVIDISNISTFTEELCPVENKIRTKWRTDMWFSFLLDGDSESFEMVFWNCVCR